MMDDNWVKIFETTDQYECDLLKAMLEDQGITTRSLSHQDSVYTSLNTTSTIELYAHSSQEEAARKIIDSKSA